MRLNTFILCLIFIVTANLSAGVIKDNKSVVSFKGFGKYITETSTKISGTQMREDEQNDFKGKGFLGNMTAKFILKPGHTGEIIKLDKMEMYSMDHQEKQYRVNPIQKIDMADYEGGQAEEYEEDVEVDEEEQESSIRIIRQEFKVEKTGESKKINNFACDQYTIKWLTVWENIETGEQGTDSLFTIVWTTDAEEKFEKARQQEMDFGKKYMEAIGVEMPQYQADMLGMHWLGLFQSLNSDDAADYEYQDSEYVKELAKIEGYPIVIDGKYFAIRPKKESQVAEEKTDIKDVKKMFGGFMKKALKKKSKTKKSTKNEPAFSYYTELKKLEVTKINNTEFEVPKDYTKIGLEE